jgi:hypothetical protein
VDAIEIERRRRTIRYYLICVASFAVVTLVFALGPAAIFGVWREGLGPLLRPEAVLGAVGLAPLALLAIGTPFAPVLLLAAWLWRRLRSQRFGLEASSVAAGLVGGGAMALVLAIRGTSAEVLAMPGLAAIGLVLPSLWLARFWLARSQAGWWPLPDPGRLED